MHHLPKTRPTTYLTLGGAVVRHLTHRAPKDVRRHFLTHRAASLVVRRVVNMPLLDERRPSLRGFARRDQRCLDHGESGVRGRDGGLAAHSEEGACSHVRLATQLCSHRATDKALVLRHRLG